MARTLLTGASGFVGSHVARALAERGDELTLMMRRTAADGHLEELDYERVTGDVTDRRAVRRAMKDAERVFHVAGRTSLRTQDRDAVFETNVRGTRVVLEEALAAGVTRAVLTSSVGAIGPAPPRGTVDENTPFTAGGLGIAYVNSKHEAEVEALRLAAKGLPLVIVNPSFALGPDSPGGTSMHLVRRFLLGRIPAYVDGGLNIVDVRDVAAGHVLADEKGTEGERYILGGRNFTLDRLFADLSRLSGVPAPTLKLPAVLVESGAGLGLLGRLPIPMGADEIRSGALWWTCKSTKAKRELGFKPRPHEETLEDAVRWQSDVLGSRIGSEGRRERAVLGAAGRVMSIGERVLGR
jgi:dihydroflavonol-4-reductase